MIRVCLRGFFLLLVMGEKSRFRLLPYDALLFLSLELDVSFLCDAFMISPPVEHFEIQPCSSYSCQRLCTSCSQVLLPQFATSERPAYIMAMEY